MLKLVAIFALAMLSSSCATHIHRHYDQKIVEAKNYHAMWLAKVESEYQSALIQPTDPYISLDPIHYNNFNGTEVCKGSKNFDACSDNTWNSFLSKLLERYKFADVNVAGKNLLTLRKESNSNEALRAGLGDDHKLPSGKKFDNYIKWNVSLEWLMRESQNAFLNQWRAEQLINADDQLRVSLQDIEYRRSLDVSQYSSQLAASINQANANIQRANMQRQMNNLQFQQQQNSYQIQQMRNPSGGINPYYGN